MATIHGLDSRKRLDMNLLVTFKALLAKLTVHIACADCLQATAVQPLALRLRRNAPGVRPGVRNLDMPRLGMQSISR